MSEISVTRFINDEKNGLLSKFGKVSVPDVHYHVVKIRTALDDSVDLDALERYTAEYLRLQLTLESEIDDVDKALEFVDSKEKPDVWMRLKRLKKELIIDKMRVLQDHELPLTVRKFKKERDKRINTLKVQPLPEGFTPPEDEIDGSEQRSSE